LGDLGPVLVPKAGKATVALDEVRAYPWWRRLLRWAGGVTLSFIALLVTVVVILSIPWVQRQLGRYVAAWASEHAGVDIRIGSLAVEPFGSLVLKEVFVGDLGGDTLFVVGALKVNGVRVDGDARTVDITSVRLDSARFALARADGDVHSNLTNLLNKLSSGDTTSTGEPWVVRCARFNITGLHFSYHDDNRPMRPFGVDFDHVDVRHADISGRRFVLARDTVTAWLGDLRLDERSGLRIDHLSGETRVGPDGILIEQLMLRTPRTEVDGRLQFTTPDWSAYSHFSQNVYMRVDLAPSRVEFADIALFAPELQGIELPIRLKGRVRGPLSDMKGRDLELYFGQRSHFKGHAELTGLPDVANTFMLLDVEELATHHTDLERLPVPPFTAGGTLQLPPEVRDLGAVRFTGNFTGFPSAFTAYGQSHTDLGDLSTDLSYERDTLSRNFRLTGHVASPSFLVGRLLGTSAIGAVGANIRIKAAGPSLAAMRAELDGTFPVFNFNQYSITGITANGTLESGLFNGSLQADDHALVLDFKGLADLRGRWPVVDFRADLQHLDLGAFGLSPFEGPNSISMLVNARGRLAPDSLLGVLEAQDVHYCKGPEEYPLGDIALRSSRAEGRNVLELDADAVHARVEGTFLPTQLPGAITNVVYSVFPALVEQVDHGRAFQDFEFRAEVRDARPVFDLFVPGLMVDSGAVITGALHSRTQNLDLAATIPSLGYGDLHLHNTEVVAGKMMDVLLFRIDSDRQEWKDSLWFGGTSITGKAYQDEVEFALGWDRSGQGTNGRLDMVGEVHGPGSYSLDLLPSRLQLGLGEWVNTKVAHARIDSSTVRISDLVMINAGQRVAIEGLVTKEPGHALTFDLQNVRLENIAPLLGGPALHGSVSGDGHVFDPLSNTYVVSYLCMDSLRVEDKPVGDLRFVAGWVGGRKAIELSGELTRGPIKALDFAGELTLGEENMLDVDLTMDRFDLAFIDPYLPEGISDIQGRVTGTLELAGRFAEPQIRGELDLQDAGLRIDYLNTLYRFTHRVIVEPDMFALDFVTVRDEEGNMGRFIGTILHKGLKDWNYNVSGEVEGLMVMNTTEQQNSLYYGKAYATGRVEVSGHGGAMEITVDARTAPGTSIHFPVGGSTEVSGIGFVHFVGGDSTGTEAPGVDLSGISLDLAVEVTPDAHFELIFDPTVGDILQGRGAGNMEMTVSQSGEFDMRGQVEVTQGEYLFTLRNIVNKRFQIEPGGRIVWFGDPFDAQLDMRATYKVRAPLYDIMFEKNEAYRKRVPVDVVMQLKDRLLNPEIAFDVRLPSVDESVRTQVNSVLSTEQERNRQVFSLIVLNRFMPPPNYGSGGAPTGGNVAGTTGFELMSNQVSNWLSSLSNDLDLGVNYRPGDAITQDEVELAVSTQLFNERLLLSTNVGVQYGATTATQNNNALIGDFQLEYLLTPEGRLRLKAFSISNDRNLNRVDQSLTTQGAGVAFREEFDTFGEFWQKMLNIFRSDEKDRKFD
jgi:hypothetical protein